jgi:hypothetical protein
MDGTVMFKVIEANSVKDAEAFSVKDERWQKDNLAQMWLKFTGKEQPKPIDQSPDRGSGWMK